MNLVVEDGSGVPGAESYASVATLVNYRSVCGAQIPEGSTEAAMERVLLQGTAYIDYQYAFVWPGRFESMTQGLAWPRLGVVDRTGCAITGIPEGLVRAACEAALVELKSPGALWTSENGNGTVRAESEGGVRKEYERGMPLLRTFPTIHAQIVSFLKLETGIRVERG